MQPTPNGVARSQTGLLNRGANGVPNIADSDQAKIGRPQAEAAIEPEFTAAELHRSDRYHDAGDLPPLALEDSANEGFHVLSQTLAELGSIRLDGYPHGALRLTLCIALADLLRFFFRPPQSHCEQSGSKSFARQRAAPIA
jgi:hypothetical protein